MDLLAQTIQEYLEERHPNWDTLSAGDGTIFLGLKTKTMKGEGYSIVIHTKEQLIGNLGRQYIHYTDNMILPLITEAINRVEKL